VERELVIQTTELGCDIALLENKELVEFHRDNAISGLAKGDMYWARVKRILPPLNAAFIDIGEEKEAFLHYTDLGENFATLQSFFKRCVTNEIIPMDKFPTSDAFPKDGKIGDVLAINDYLPVEVLKEPLSTKGARLSSDISLAGRYIVLIPFGQSINVSKKIENREERTRLKEIVNKIKHRNVGVIVRTVAMDMSLKELHQDYLDLMDKWNAMSKMVINASGVTKIFEEESKSTTLLRDVLNDSFTKIHINSESMSKSIQSYIEKIAPDKADIVKYYKNQPYLFEEFNLTSRIKSAFNRIIPLKSRGYIIIEQTEAMYVVDVNSGLSVNKKTSLDSDESILQVNLEAAKEIARQLRLRDIGGIIVIDFIDSKNPEIRDRIFEAMQEFMRDDKASSTILPLSRFCLMQITRSRTRPQEKVVTKEECPSCKGTGKITNVILITDLIYNRLQTLVHTNTSFEVVVHPFIFAYLKLGVISEHLRWQWALRTRFMLRQNSNLGINEFQLIDSKTKELLTA
jgi:ribonuclease G